MVRIYTPDGKVVEKSGESIPLEDLLFMLQINSVRVVIAKNGVLVTERENASGNDEIRIFNISHGG